MFTDIQLARIVHPLLKALAPKIPELRSVTDVFVLALEQRFPELQVIAGPSEPPVVPPSYRVGPGVSPP